MKESVQVVLLNKDGEVLAVSRKTDHNDFGLIGGKRDPEDYTLIDAAIRETKEETGLDIYNLRLIFTMHKDGYMGYTYLADWDGFIHTDEPHVVKWTDFTEIMKGSFGKWNKLVCESLMSMGIFIKIHNGLCEICNNSGSCKGYDESDVRNCHGIKHYSNEKYLNFFFKKYFHSNKLLLEYKSENGNYYK